MSEPPLNVTAMRICDLEPSQVESARALLMANGWAHRVGDPGQFAALVRNSQRAAVALQGPEIIGFARAITDASSNGYLSMVCVAPDHRRHGVGSALVAHVTAGPPGITWMLRAERAGAEAFFTKLGFVASPSAMQRTRR